ncbi:MAG: XcyI family restriction endonuclease [Tepidisphaeraceae bacterium]
MARSSDKVAVIRCPSIHRQIAFQQLLAAARKTWLHEALSEALSAADPAEVKQQLILYAPEDAQRLLAAARIRDEHVFPVPIILETKPTLVGYYRLLAGIPQKSFYAGGTGMARFKSMETSGILRENQRDLLPTFCRELGRALGEIIKQISPAIKQQDVDQLPILTLGAQFQGANNVLIGQQATRGVFLVIGKLTRHAIVERTNTKIVLQNSSGNTVVISLAHDPDVRVQLKQGESLRNKLAIEIKGGTDRSNAHNRAGEAEKSHQKARSQDFRECWTLIAMKGLKKSRLKEESPSTDQWFDVAQVLSGEGEDWEEFRARLADAVGIPIMHNRRRGGRK